MFEWNNLFFELLYLEDYFTFNQHVIKIINYRINLINIVVFDEFQKLNHCSKKTFNFIVMARY